MSDQIPAEVYEKYPIGNRDLYRDVDNYICGKVVPEPPEIQSAVTKNLKQKLPNIAVAPNQGKFLQLLALSSGAKTILEIGTLGAYSTLWMARALPKDGKIITLEADTHHANVARYNISRAGLENKIEVRVGPALESLEKLVEENAGPFDFVFSDADEVNLANYLEWSIKLGRVGTVIVVDNVVRSSGPVWPNVQPPPGDSEEEMREDAEGVDKMFDFLKYDTRVDATAIQTVGVKGWDGFMMAVVTGK